MKWKDTRWLALDIGTISFDEPTIIDLAVVSGTSDGPSSIWQAVFNPGDAVLFNDEAVTGYSEARLLAANEFNEVSLQRMLTRLVSTHGVLVVYNRDYVAALLESLNVDLPESLLVIDMLNWMSFFDADNFQSGRLKLQRACERQGIQRPQYPVKSGCDAAQIYGLLRRFHSVMPADSQDVISREAVYRAAWAPTVP